MSDDGGGAARIEQLLEDLRSLAAGPVWQRVEELVQRLLSLYGSGLERCLGHLAQLGRLDDALAERLASDDLLSPLLLLHGLHPWPVERRAREALERVRPQLSAHLGDFVFLGVEGDVARLRLTGTPVADLSAERLVHRALVDVAPEISRVELEGLRAPPPRPRPEALVQIGLPRARTGAP
jgi:hypothetical protein